MRHKRELCRNKLKEWRHKAGISIKYYKSKEG